MALIPRIRSWIRPLIFASSILLVLRPASYSAVAAASKKQKVLEHLAERGPVVTLTDGNFTRYAEGKSKPYHLVLLFTAMLPTYNCASCRLMDIPFVKVAEEYAAQHNIVKEENRIVFARLDIDNNRATFGKYSVATAPHCYAIPMGKVIPSSPSELRDLEITDGLGGHGGSIDSYLDALNRVTGIKIVILPDTSGLLEGALLIGIALGVVGHFFAGVPSRSLAFVRSRGLWFVVSMACYLTGVGGMIFCIIRNPKTHGYNHETGGAAMFSPGGRDQFWYEGAVVALLYVGMSSAILGIYAGVGWKRAPSMAREVVVMACVTLLCYLSGEFLKLYMGKTQWYQLSQMLPSMLGDLHSETLKRKHGLLRRLVRLSHLWLNKYTTLEAFRGKLKTLLWDYIVRRVKTSLGW